MFDLIYSKIASTGSYLPEKILTNFDLEKMVDISNEWIVKRTGIHQRRIASDRETTCDLAAQAAMRAIESAGVSASQIDLIVVATTTPDRVFPSTACLLQERLGIHGCTAFDVQAVCSGFVYALSVVDKFIKCNSSKCALVVGAETLSRILNWKDQNTCILFGDGAGAFIVQKAKKPGILSTHLHADGRYKELLTVSGGVSENSEMFQNGGAYIRMQGNELFKKVVNSLRDILSETLQANGLQQSDIDWFIPHQANKRIINAATKKLKMSMDRVVTTVEQHGNTSAASIPLAFDVAVRDGRIKRGETVLLEACGSGFTWGSVLLRY